MYAISNTFIFFAYYGIINAGEVSDYEEKIY